MDTILHISTATVSMVVIAFALVIICDSLMEAHEKMRR